jgi:hypothetical protein
MALKHGKINPLNVLGYRQLKIIPEHFTVITIEQGPVVGRTNNEVTKWIFENLHSRFAIVSDVKLSEQNAMRTVIRIGFEDPKESSMFMLMCPLI